MNDILDNLIAVLIAFRKDNLSPPEAIILKNHEDGMRFLSAISSGNLVYRAGENASCKTVEHPDGSVWMQFTYMNLDIRFPAKKYATEDGYIWG